MERFPDTIHGGMAFYQSDLPAPLPEAFFVPVVAN
jgi:hypothetical protein